MFGCLGDTSFRITRTGIETCRRCGFYDDVQRSFYYAYFGSRGLKVKAITLPSGMIDSTYVGVWKVSDAGLLNMSGLNTYLSGVLSESGL